MAEEEKQDQAQNLPVQVNTFEKGLVMDIDPRRVPPNMFIDSENVRVINKGDNDYVVQFIRGNEYEEAEGHGFQLTRGYVPIGWCVTDGILFIASANIDSSGTGEIGCYPSCDWAAGFSDYTKTYRPLYNRDNAGRTAMNTDLLNFLPNRQIEMFGLYDFDGSVNLYICGDYNPNKIINSGFVVSTGRLTERMIETQQFNTTVPMIPRQEDTCNIALSTINGGGNWGYGNYFFFARYMTAERNKTHFLAESNACQIFKGVNTIKGIEGGDGSSGVINSNKRVVLNVTNIDMAYRYIQFGYIRYHSDPNYPVTFEVSLIDKDYEITSPTETYYLTGNEGFVTLTIDELLRPRSPYDRCKSHLSLENKYWGGNWLGNKRHYDSLAMFAKRVKINYDDSLTMDGSRWTPDDIVSAMTSNGQYKYAGRTYDYVGYFRGEPYPFGIVFQFTDGLESAAYPCQGGDFYYSTTGIHQGESGIFRFPRTQDSNYYNPGDVLKIMGVKFDLSAVNTSDLPSNVKGFYFVRGPRYETLQYQGIAMNVCGSEVIASRINYTNDCTIGLNIINGANQYNGGLAKYLQYGGVFDTWNGVWGNVQSAIPGFGTIDDKGKYIPCYRGYMPMSYTDLANVYAYTSRWFAKKDKYAIFCPDFLFRDENSINIGCMIRVAYTKYRAMDNWVHSASDGVPAAGTKGINPIWTLAEVDNAYYFSNDRKVQRGDWGKIGEDADIYPNTGGQFINRSGSHYSGDDAMFLASGVGNRFWSTRALKTQKYISLDITYAPEQDELGAAPLYYPDDFNLDIVNLYLVDPESFITYESLEALFGRNIEYSKISGMILRSEVDTYDNNTVYYKGDCFLQRTYFKMMGWPEDTNLTDTDRDNSTTPYYHSHGVVIGIITENKLNTAMRLSKDNNKYYPLNDDAHEFCRLAFNSDTAEYLKRNAGYDQILSPLKYFSHDPNIPLVEDHKKTRIYYSPEKTPGEIVDSFREILTGNYKDFDATNGEIIKLVQDNGILISVQEDSINRHHINVQRTVNDTEGNDIVIGTGDMLSSKFQVLAEFGSQHQWSIMETPFGVFGVDWKRSVIWNISRGMVGITQQHGANDLTLRLACTKWLVNLKKEWEDSYPYKDEILRLSDNPIYEGGINIGYDPKNKEVIFSIAAHYKYVGGIDATYIGNDIYTGTLLVANGNVPEIGDELYALARTDTNLCRCTLVITKIESGVGLNNYDIEFKMNNFLDLHIGISAFAIVIEESFAYSVFGFFHGRRNYYSPMWIDWDNEFLSFKRDYTSLLISHKFYHHHKEAPVLTFFGEKKQGMVQIVVNKGTEEKIFENMMIVSPETFDALSKLYGFEKIVYETDRQVSIHDPFIDHSDLKPWLDPEFNDDKYELPIKLEEVGVGQYKEMRGTYLKISLYYEGNDSSFVREIYTFFGISKI